MGLRPFRKNNRPFRYGCVGVWVCGGTLFPPILPYFHTPIQYKRNNYFSVTALSTRPVRSAERRMMPPQRRRFDRLLQYESGGPPLHRRAACRPSPHGRPTGANDDGTMRRTACWGLLRPSPACAWRPPGVGEGVRLRVVERGLMEGAVGRAGVPGASCLPRPGHPALPSAW